MADFVSCHSEAFRITTMSTILMRRCFSDHETVTPSREESRALLEKPVSEDGLNIITNEQLNERKENE